MLTRRTIIFIRTDKGNISIIFFFFDIHSPKDNFYSYW